MNIFSKSQSKIILAVYVGTSGMNDSDAKEFLNAVNDYGRTFDKSIYTIVIPDKYAAPGIKVECLNPVRLTDDDYYRVDNIIKEAEEKLKQI